MIETLTPPEIQYLLDNVEYRDIVRYCTVHKDEIEYFTNVLSQHEKDALMLKVSKEKAYDADAYDTSQKELIRAVYRLKRRTISEAEQMELLKPFFPDMSQRYSMLLDENSPVSNEMTFECLLANIERLYETTLMSVFDQWETCIYLDRRYLKRYVDYIRDSEAFGCLFHHERNQALRIIKRYAGSIAKPQDCKEKIESYNIAMRDKLNILLLAIYFEQNSKPYYYLHPDQLNMYQGFELETVLEEALDALFLLKEEVNIHMMKADKRGWFAKHFFALFKR